MQFVDIELDPGELALAEAGSMFYMSAGIGMETIFGDARSGPQASGFIDKLLGACKRLLTGESLFHDPVHQQLAKGQGAVHLRRALRRQDHMQKGRFFCAARGVALETAFQKRLGVGLFGG